MANQFKLGGDAQKSPVNSGVIINQMKNSGGIYENHPTVKNIGMPSSTGNSGINITQSENTNGSYKNNGNVTNESTWIAVPGQTLQPSSSVVWQQNPPPSKYPVNSGVNIVQTNNRGGRYGNEPTVMNIGARSSTGNTGVNITQSENTAGTYQNKGNVTNKSSWITDPDQTPQPCSSEAWKQNPSLSNPTAYSASRPSSNEALVIAASELQIQHSEKKSNWKWIPSPDGTKLVELLKVWSLHIEAKIKLKKLLPKREYAAYLIFKILPGAEGLNSSQEASVSVGRDLKKKVVCVAAMTRGTHDKDIGFPLEKADGWMELELGQFYSGDGEDDTEVVINFLEPSNTKKTGFLVAGIEVRPI